MPLIPSMRMSSTMHPRISSDSPARKASPDSQDLAATPRERKSQESASRMAASSSTMCAVASLMRLQGWSEREYRRSASRCVRIEIGRPVDLTDELLPDAALHLLVHREKKLLEGEAFHPRGRVYLGRPGRHELREILLVLLLRDLVRVRGRLPDGLLELASKALR